MTGKRPRGRPSNVDWKSVRADYEAGDLTIREIAEKHGTTYAAVQKRAEREGWKREKQPDGSKFQRAKPLNGELIVVRRQGEGSAGPEPSADDDKSLDPYRSPVDVILTHRRRIARASRVAERLTGELEAVTEYAPTLEHLIEAVFAGGGINGAVLRQALRERLDVGNRIKNLANLSKALGELVNLERQAYGMDGPKAIADPVAAANLEAERHQGATRSKEEIARAILDMIERASREKQKATMQ